MTLKKMWEGLNESNRALFVDDQAGPVANKGTWTITLPDEYLGKTPLVQIKACGTYGAGDAGARTFTPLPDSNALASLVASAKLAGVLFLHNAPAVASEIITTADGTDLATNITLANAMKTWWAAHVASTTKHLAADATNVTSAAVATDQSTLNTLINELKADFNAHQDSATYHNVNGGVGGIATPLDISTADATDLATSVTLVNVIKGAYNRHVASGAGGGVGMTSFVETTGVVTMTNNSGGSLSNIRTVIEVIGDVQ